jgi:site-specific DNA-methyltransferase (adenine-specific)
LDILTIEYKDITKPNERGNGMSTRLLGELELNRIYQRDCLEGMAMIPEKSIDMILCDLPYGTTQNKWDSVIALDPLWKEYKRIIKDNGAIVLTSAEPFTSKLIQSNLSNFKYKWVWDKANPSGFLNAKKQPLRVTEDVLVFYKKQCTYNPRMEVRGAPRKKGGYIKPNGSDNYGSYEDSVSVNNEYYPTNLLRISNANRSEKVHPTQKPVALFQYLIETYTNPGMTVLDNCIGSGTTAIAALRTGRQFIGFETEPAYVEIANKRIDNEMETN